MSTIVRLARILSESPLDTPLRWLASKLDAYVDLTDNYSNGDPATNGEYELIRRAAPHWRMVFDVGANVGDWTATVLASNASCTLHAFEASPAIFERLKTRADQLPSVVLHPVGLGAVVGEAEFNDCGADSGLSSFVNRSATLGIVPARTVRVRTTTVDRFLEEQAIGRVDFIKIDTEGFEMPILRGMVRALRTRTVAALQFEYGGTWLDAGETLCSAAKLLSEHGYELLRLMPFGARPVAYNPARDENYKYANFLAVSDLKTLEQWGVQCV